MENSRRPKIIDTKSALSKAMYWCSQKEMCSHDIIEKLMRLGLSKNDANGVVNQLIKDNFLNEERFTKAFINDKSKFSGWGIIRISMALKQKNIDESLIKKHIQNIDEDSQYQKIKDLAIKKKATIKKGTDYEIKAKIFRFLAYRGFPISLIQKVLDEIIY